VVRTRSRCFECGHQWSPRGILYPNRCPHCAVAFSYWESSSRRDVVCRAHPPDPSEHRSRPPVEDGYPVPGWFVVAGTLSAATLAALVLVFLLYLMAASRPG